MARMLIVCAAALAVASSAATAQSAPSACYLQVSKLVAGPGEGIDELGDAIRKLDTALRPQVEEIKVLEAQLERLEERQRDALGGEEETDLVTLQADTQRITEDLQAKRSQLKLDYAAQRQALVAPVQVRVSERVHKFAAENGCAEMEMVRGTELEGRRATSARDMTGAFVAWYDGP